MQSLKPFMFRLCCEQRQLSRSDCVLHERDSIPGRGKIASTSTSRKHGGASSFQGQCIQGAPSCRVDRSKREAGHSPPSTAKIENVWRLTSIIPHILVTVMLEHRENFIVTIIRNVQLIQTKVGQNVDKIIDSIYIYIYICTHIHTYIHIYIKVVPVLN
jgi:hypothetical protein